MKILIDCSNMRTGGALQNGLSFLNFARFEKSHRWYVVVSGELAEEIPRNWDAEFEIFVRHGEKKGWSDIRKASREVSRLEAKWRPHLVFSLAGPPYWRAQAVHISGFAKAQYLYPEINIFFRMNRWIAIKSRLKRWPRMFLQKKLFKRTDYLVGQTTTVKKRCCQTFDLDKKDFFVVRNSFSPLFAKALEVVDNDSERSEESSKILFVPSAWYVHKNLECVPEVAKKLKNLGYEDFCFRFTLPKTSVAWLGIQNMAERLGVNDKLETVGNVPHAKLATRYLESWLVFLPTLLESSTAVYPEAMAAKKPVVTCDLDFAREACSDAALYFSPFDPTDAAEKIGSLLKSTTAYEQLVQNIPAALSAAFPSPKEKFQAQVKMLNEVAKREEIETS